MAHTTWFFLAYGAALFFLLVRPDKVAEPRGLRLAWKWFVFAVFVEAFFTLLRAANHDRLSIGLVEIWAAGISWFCVAMSLLRLPQAFNLPATRAKEQTPLRANESVHEDGFDELDKL